MIKQREGYKVIVEKKALERIEKDQCPSCSKPKNEWDRRKDWRCCSIKCTEKYVKELVTFGWPDLRIKAFKRDKYACVKCGYQPKKETWKDIYTEKGGKITVNDTTQLIGDHITPIAIGGDEWNINNIQTLCKTCDKKKTRKDHKDISLKRKHIVLKQKGQLMLDEQIFE